MNRLLILVSFITVIFFTYGCTEQTTNVKSETSAVEKESQVETQLEDEPSTNEEQSSSEKALNAFAEAGKEINLTEEEMIQKGEEAVKKFQENINIKTMDEFETWFKETMYNEDYYESFKDSVEQNLAKSEVISINVETKSVSPNSAYTYQWNGVVTTKYKVFEENLTYTDTNTFTLQMYENERGKKDYKIIRFDAQLTNQVKEPLK